MSVKSIPIKLSSWTKNIRNSNEKRVLKYLKLKIPQYKNIQWTEDIFLDLFISIMNSLPPRYKQKNSIVLSGRIDDEKIQICVEEKLKELSKKNPLEK